MKNQDKEIYRSKKYRLEKDDLLRQIQELNDLVQHLRKDNDNLNMSQKNINLFVIFGLIESITRTENLMGSRK
ncbi:unnamed protein product [Paramecium pentaurelia]|uniref:Uncharacterized protein n=1 Tax=Paramecium pentaurelia TaxID=43138 RepID=A0A8S1VHY4_9CILI|nr:unnamed protein product [Paramecium pentaurelia]